MVRAGVFHCKTELFLISVTFYACCNKIQIQHRGLLQYRNLSKIHLKLKPNEFLFAHNLFLSTLRPRQNGRHFANNIFKCNFLMKMFEFQLRFQWSLFPRVKLTIFHHWFRWWLGADQATSHYLNQGWEVYWRIYASLGLNELIGQLFWNFALSTAAIVLCHVQSFKVIG